MFVRAFGTPKNRSFLSVLARLPPLEKFLRAPMDPRVLKKTTIEALVQFLAHYDLTENKGFVNVTLRSQITVHYDKARFPAKSYSAPNHY